MFRILFEWLIKMDRWQLFLEFLSFHRRFIIGCFLIAGLAVFFTKVFPNLRRIERSNRSSNGSANREQSADSPVQSSTNKSNQVNATPPKSKQDLLDSKDPEELLDESIRLRESTAATRSESAKLVIANERFQLAKRALEMSPNLQQRRTLASELTQSALMLLQDRKRADSHFDESEFLKIAHKFKDDADKEVQSFGFVILTSSRYLDFRNQLSNDSLKEFKTSIDDYFDHLTRQPIYLRQFCILLIQNDILVAPDLDLDSTVDALSKRMLNSDLKEIRQIGHDIDLNFGFLRLLPNQLAEDLISARDEKTDGRVDAYFDQLAKHPDSNIPQYQIALDIIRSYLSLNQRERVAQCIDSFENRILINRQDKASSERIRTALEELKKIHRETEPR